MIFVNDHPADLTFFADNSPHIRQSVEFNDGVSIVWCYENIGELFAIVCITRHLQEKGMHHIHLYMPYCPNARMDRTKKDSDVFTLKYMAEIINNLHFDSAHIFDPHSDVSTALLNNVRVSQPTQFIEKAIEDIRRDMLPPDSKDEPILFYYPDRGAMERYKELFPNMPYLYGDKQRDWDTSKIVEMDVRGDHSKLQGANVLIIDDICSSGNTLYLAAKDLKALGAKRIFVYVSHTENQLPKTELMQSGIIDAFFTTNSLYRSNLDAINQLVKTDADGVQMQHTTHIYVYPYYDFDPYA